VWLNAKAAARAMSDADHEVFDRYRGALVETRGAVWWTFP
jgi:hypothetical protein